MTAGTVGICIQANTGRAKPDRRQAMWSTVNSSAEFSGIRWRDDVDLKGLVSLARHTATIRATDEAVLAKEESQIGLVRRLSLSRAPYIAARVA